MNVHNRLIPIDALAAHFRSSGSGSGEKRATLGVPSFLRASLDEKLDPPAGETRASFTTKEVKILVESIGEEDYERWCLLDTAAFAFMTKVLLGATSCLAKDQGLFRLIEALETWNDDNNELAMSKEQLVDYKNIVGESLVVDLLVYFTEKEGSEFSRRWVGLLLAELLEDSNMNRQLVWEMPDKTFKDIGEIITSGADRMLKIVAGKIIWQMAQHFGDEVEIRYRLSAFWNASDAGDFTKKFPLQNGSQWENGFANFINDMEEDRYDLNIGLPTGYNAYQVKIGSNNRIDSEFGAISISVAEIFSIYIPPNRDHSPDWVDFKIVNISRVEFTSQGVTGDAMKDLTYFKLHLCDYEEDGYLYLLSMRPSSDSDSVVILCDRTDAEDFAEEVERYRDRVLKPRSNKLSTTSAPVKDIQANPVGHQSQQEKLKELERHRDDILKVLDSPAKKNIGSAMVTGLSEGGDALGFQVSEEKLEKPPENLVADPDLMELEDEINDHGPESFNQDSASSPVISGQRSLLLPTADNPVQKPIKIPNIVLEELGNTSGPSRSIYNFTRDLSDEISEAPLRSSPAHLRSSIRVQQTAKNLNVSTDSDSELSDLTGVSDETELELLFRGALVGQRGSVKPAKSRVKLQEKPESFSSNAARRLDFPDLRAVKFENKLKKKIPRLPAPAASEPLGVPARLVESPLFNKTTVMGGYPGFKGARRQRPHPVISDTLGVSEVLGGPLGVVSAAGMMEEARRSPNHAVRNFLDGVLITKTPGESKPSLGGNNQPTMPRTIGSPDVPAKKMVEESGGKAEKKSRLGVPGMSTARGTQVNEKGMGLVDTPTKKPRSVVPKRVGQMDDPPIVKSRVASGDDSKKKPRPAVHTIPGFLDDVLTPPGTSEARQMVRQKGGLKERLVGKYRESEKRATSAQTASIKSNPASRSYKKVASLEKPKLVSPEDTSIWELPESEHSGKEKKPLPKKKGKAESKKQPPLSKVKQQPKKRTYGKKSVIKPKLKVNEPISDSDKEMKTVEEDLFRAKAPIPKPRRKIAPKSAPAKRAVKNSDGGKFPTRVSKPKAVRKLAPTPAPARNVAVEASNKEVNATAEYKLPMDLEQKSKSKFPPEPILVKRAIADDSEYEDSSAEDSNIPARSPNTVPPRKIAPVSAPTKNMTTQNINSKPQNKDSSQLTGGRNTERARAARVNLGSESSRTAIEKAQETSNKPSKFDIFQNTSEPDIDSSWRPKTRLQAKLELFAKSATQKGAAEVGNKNTRRETFRGTESSEESRSESEDISYPTAKFRKTLDISGNRGALSTEIRDAGTVRRSPSLNSEIFVKSPINSHEQRTEARGAEPPIYKQPRSPEGLILETPTQPSTRNREEQAELRAIHANSKRENIIIIPSESESGLEVMAVNITDSVILDNGPKKKNGIFKPITGQLNIKGSWLDSDTEMADNPAAEDWDGDEPVRDHRERGSSSTAQLTENLASAAVVDLRVPGPDVEKHSKFLSPATPRRLDRTPRTPLALLIDDHLARKAQIISWNSEGPKNQGRTLVVDHSPVHPDTSSNQEDSTDSEFLPKLGRDLSLYVLASEDEDRIVRQKMKPGSFVVCPNKKNTGTRVSRNGSPLLATRDDYQEDSKDQKDDLVMADIINNFHVNQESCLESEQEGEWHPASVKKLREASRANRIGFRNANSTSANPKMRVTSDDEGQAYSVTGRLERVRGFSEDEKYVTEEKVARHEDRVRRKISIVEILESDTERIDGAAQVGPPGVYITEHRKFEKISSRRNLVAEKVYNIIKPSTPIVKKRLLALNKRPIAFLGRSPVLQPSSPVARETSHAIDDSLVGKRRSYPQTGFFNWLQETRFGKPNNDNHTSQYSHRGLNRNLQSVDPNITLVNDEDPNGTEMDWGFVGNSQEEPDRGQKPQDLWGSDSDDSSDFSIDSDEEGDQGEALSEIKEDPQLNWRRSLPDYHRETLAVLDQISEGLLRYLMSGEELAMEVIKDFEKQGKEIVKQLGESHRREYDNFLARANIGKEEVKKQHTIIMEAVGQDIIELQEKQLTLAGLRTNTNDDYSALDITISKLIAQLEEELEEGI